MFVCAHGMHEDCLFVRMCVVGCEKQDDGRRSANSKGTSSRVHEEATCGSNSQMASLGFQGALGKIPNARFVTRPRKTGIVFARPAKQTAIQVREQPIDEKGMSHLFKLSWFGHLVWVCNEMYSNE